MKEFYLEYSLIKAAPKNSHTDVFFTDRVMESLQHTSVAARLPQVTRQPFLSRLKHLPKFIILLLALAILFTVSGVTYAIVETVRLSNVSVQESGMNAFGREQLTVAFDSCAQQKKAGTTYELKKDSELSADDGAKVIQARCELDVASAWIGKDEITQNIVKDDRYVSSSIKSGVTSSVGEIDTISNSEITLKDENSRSFAFPNDARVIEDNKPSEHSAIRAGDTILYFSPFTMNRRNYTDPTVDVVVFKLKLPAKYYDLTLQSYVSTRGACTANPERECLLHNSINSVTLIVSQGGAQAGSSSFKNLQGKVLEYDAHHIKLDVGKGVIYTIQTPSNIIGKYNQTTVYGLKGFDSIYSKTDTEALKIAAGDTLEIYYNEEADQATHELSWSQTLSISLLVERTVKNMEVIRKY